MYDDLNAEQPQKFGNSPGGIGQQRQQNDTTMYSGIIDKYYQAHTPNGDSPGGTGQQRHQDDNESVSESSQSPSQIIDFKVEKQFAVTEKVTNDKNIQTGDVSCIKNAKQECGHQNSPLKHHEETLPITQVSQRANFFTKKLFEQNFDIAIEENVQQPTIHLKHPKELTFNTQVSQRETFFTKRHLNRNFNIATEENFPQPSLPQPNISLKHQEKYAPNHQVSRKGNSFAIEHFDDSNIVGNFSNFPLKHQEQRLDYTVPNNRHEFVKEYVKNYVRQNISKTRSQESIPNLISKHHIHHLNHLTFLF